MRVGDLWICGRMLARNAGGGVSTHEVRYASPPYAEGQHGAKRAEQDGAWLWLDRSVCCTHRLLQLVSLGHEKDRHYAHRSNKVT